MMTPITRIEHYLAKMNGEDVQIPAPITRKELYLAKICGEDVEVPEPVTIDEKFLYALAGGEVNLPNPITRLQHAMAIRLGIDDTEIIPITREEYFWLADGGPSATVKGFAPLTLLNALARKIKKLTQIGKCTVSGTDITCNNGVLKYDSELGIYADGTPEEIKVTASGVDGQTATASNLFSVGSVTDEQDIISGTITRRCEAVVSDGTTPSGRYIGTVGEGNIIVQTKETGYSGAIASFEADKAEPLSGLVAEINPVQDLHGQDAPYPAGGGKNKCLPYSDRTSHSGIYYTVEDQAIKINGTASGASYSWVGASHADYANCPIKLTAGTYTFTSSAVPGANQSEGYLAFLGYKESGGAISNIVIAGTDLQKTVTFSENVGIFYGFYVASGISVNITAQIQIESGSTATAWTPYENICPISGHTGLSVEVTGFNVWDEEWELGVFNNSTGEKSPNGSNFRSKNKIPVVDGKTYYFHAPSTARIFWYSESAFLSTYVVNANSVITAPTGAKYLNFQTGGTTYNHDISINYPSTDTSYHAYTGEAISVSWQDEAGTVYGGSDEVVGGELTSELANIVFDGSDSTGWSRVATYGTVTRFDKSIAGLKPNSGANLLCNYLKRGAIGTANLECCNVHGSSSVLQIQITTSRLSADSVAGLMAYFSDNPLQAVYELATPTTFTHAPTQISTLLGQNNVWVDTGDVTAYVPDFTTEQVSGQPLSTTEGTNTVFVTSNVDPVELEVKYAGGEEP